MKATYLNMAIPAGIACGLIAGAWGYLYEDEFWPNALAGFIAIAVIYSICGILEKIFGPRQ